MEIKWLTQELSYDGSQLDPLHNYLKHDLLGDSMVGWAGPCAVATEHMIDGEDLKDQSVIAGDKMLHFVLEVFEFPLTAAVSFQRLMGEILVSQLKSASPDAVDLVRRGDDLYLGQRKFNISIATATVNSSLIHFAVNIVNEGTPVPTCCLADFGITDVESFASSYMKACQSELLAIKRATRKVRQF